MDTRDARPAISDLPLDLFGDADVSEPVRAPREPDVYCWRCREPLTDGIATCVRCGGQNEPIPIVTSTSSPSFEHDTGSESSSYLGRLAFAFAYIGGDIARGAIRAGASLVDHILEWTISASGPDDRRR